MSDGIYFDVNGLDEFKLLCEKSQELAAQAADNTVSYIAAEGRKHITQTEESVFHFGRPQLTGGYYTKKNKGSSVHPNANMWVRTVKSPKLGGWISTSNGLRMVNFKFNKIAHKNLWARKGKSKVVMGVHIQAVSEVSVSSQLNNLWYKRVEYTKNSPWVGSNPFKRWKAGEFRNPKAGFDETEIKAGMSQAIPKAKLQFKKTLKDKGWK